jgi:hypothetical protein
MFGNKTQEYVCYHNAQSLPSHPPQKTAGRIYKAIIFFFFSGRELGFPLEQKKGG